MFIMYLILAILSVVFAKAAFFDEQPFEFTFHISVWLLSVWRSYVYGKLLGIFQ